VEAKAKLLDDSPYTREGTKTTPHPANKKPTKDYSRPPKPPGKIKRAIPRRVLRAKKPCQDNKRKNKIPKGTNYRMEPSPLEKTPKAWKDLKKINRILRGPIKNNL